MLCSPAAPRKRACRPVIGGILPAMRLSKSADEVTTSGSGAKTAPRRAGPLTIARTTKAAHKKSTFRTLDEAQAPCRPEQAHGHFQDQDLAMHCLPICVFRRLLSRISRIALTHKCPLLTGEFAIAPAASADSGFGEYSAKSVVGESTFVRRGTYRMDSLLQPNLQAGSQPHGERRLCLKGTSSCSAN